MTATTAGAGSATGDLSAADKAAVLIEALPYLRRFAGSVVVVKYGGNAMPAGGEGAAGSAELALFAEDVVLLHSVGLQVVVVHGGGPQIGALMARLGKVPEFVDGLRVTDADTLDIVRMVLVGKVNRDIVGAVNVHGSLAVGVSGEDAGLLLARPSTPELGFVGHVEAVDPGILQRLLATGIIPVLATIGSDAEGQAFNINADTAAGAVAEALAADKLVYLTDVEGLRADDPETLLSAVTADDLDRLVATGAVSGGMIPKVESAAKAVRGSVGRAHILDGRIPHVLLLEIFTRSGIGTMVDP